MKNPPLDGKAQQRWHTAPPPHLAHPPSTAGQQCSDIRKDVGKLLPSSMLPRVGQQATTPTMAPPPCQGRKAVKSVIEPVFQGACLHPPARPKYLVSTRFLGPALVPTLLHAMHGG
jgi:hypothetical protein